MQLILTKGKVDFLPPYCPEFNSMEIFINNEAFQTPEDSTLTQVLSKNGLAEQKGIAVAINNTVVPKTNWENKKLIPQDKITVIKATQGG